jgi:hypothetical protein
VSGTFSSALAAADVGQRKREKVSGTFSSALAAADVGALPGGAGCGIAPTASSKLNDLTTTRFSMPEVPSAHATVPDSPAPARHGTDLAHAVTRPKTPCQWRLQIGLIDNQAVSLRKSRQPAVPELHGINDAPLIWDQLD